MNYSVEKFSAVWILKGGRKEEREQGKIRIEISLCPFPADWERVESSPKA